MKNTTKLIKAQPYMTANELYLKLVYEIEDDKTVRHIIFPKVALSISTTDLNIYYDFDPTPYYREFKGRSYIITLRGDHLPIEKGTVYETDMNEQLQCVPNVESLEVIVKEKSHDGLKMTIAEIENILGYKVEIVNKEENNHD